MKNLLLISFVLILSSCSAIHTKVSKSELDVQTKMSNSIFLEPVAPSKRTVLVQVRNTSDKPGFSIEEEIRTKLRSRGYLVVDDPANANYMLQANILMAGREAENAADGNIVDPLAGAAAGGAIGSTVGKGSGNTAAIAGGAVIGGLATYIANSAVDDVTYTIVTDIQLSERPGNTKVSSSSSHRIEQGSSGSSSITYSEQSNWKRYRTKIVSTANQADLTWEDAKDPLVAGLVQSIGGLF